MGIFKLKRKSFTKYDETDNLKRMKDSDILAEKPKKGPSAIPAIGNAAVGAAGGAAIGAIAGGIKGKSWKAARKGGKAGAIIGGTMLLAGAMNKRSKEARENDFYNDRLEYAQRQAKRREKKDWKENMTQRDGYSF